MVRRIVCSVALVCSLGCPAAPEDVIEKETMATLDPLDGSPTAGPPVFEVSVGAEIDPPYDREAEGDPLQHGILLHHCGAAVLVSEDDVRVPGETVAVEDVGAVLTVDYDAYGEQELRLGGAGPYNLSVIYDASGAAAYSDASTWSDTSALELGVFPRALDPSVAVFELDLSAEPVLMMLDPSASYDADTQTLQTRYTFQTESGRQHTVTESYAFAGRYLPAMQTTPRGCD